MGLCAYIQEVWSNGGLSPAIVVKVLVHNSVTPPNFVMYSAQHDVSIVHVVHTAYSGYYSVTIAHLRISIVHAQDIIVLLLYMLRIL